MREVGFGVGEKAAHLAARKHVRASRTLKTSPVILKALMTYSSLPCTNHVGIRIKKVQTDAGSLSLMKLVKKFCH